MRRWLMALLAGALLVTTASAAGAQEDYEPDDEGGTYLALGDSVVVYDADASLPNRNTALKRS